jgi:hypothetical protein
MLPLPCLQQADDRLALLQHGTRLYLVDTSVISRDLFRQLLLVRWEAPRIMTLAEPLPVKQLMAAALQLEEAAGKWQVSTGRLLLLLLHLLLSLVYLLVDALPVLPVLGLMHLCRFLNYVHATPGNARTLSS